MAAYVIADVKVTNPDIFREYMNQVPSTVERYGGKYLVRGGSLEQFEGVWEPSRLVVIAVSYTHLTLPTICSV